MAELQEAFNIDQLASDVKRIIDQGKAQGADAINYAICLTNWKFGKRIVMEEQKGNERAEYGKKILEKLSKRLQQENGFTAGVPPRDLRNCRQFYSVFPDYEIWYARVPNLNWTHYSSLLNCAETSKDLARYSILHDNNQLFAAKYLTYIPKKEDLLAEIERQKEFFELQEKENM